MNNTTKLTGYAMIVAPLLMLIADSNSLIFEYPKNFWFGTIIFWLSFFSFIGLIRGLYHISNGTKLALVGTMIAIFGVLAGTTIIGLGRVTWAINEAGLTDEISKAVGHPMVFISSVMIGLAFPIGLIILAFSTYKAKAINLISLIILIIGILLFPTGRIIVGASANVPGDIIMLFIYGKLGLDLIQNRKTYLSKDE